MTCEQVAASSGVKIALHLEPYDGRSTGSVHLDLQHLYSIFLDPAGPHIASSAALLKAPCSCNSEQMCPVIFVYDSYRLPPGDWQQLFGNKNGLRCSRNDIFAIALWLSSDGGEQVNLSLAAVASPTM